ncbi:hypothetical protein EHS25_003171 [Saitozyma podzolica]|uniref:Uncharacterized protein n=1 Tax=Saitozyma podzolica TaxID=1890683 RepID=A0A427Y835_9TREE|nr:hypothetical protein EHS25_003171 [Saitozyma podzolica]
MVATSGPSCQHQFQQPTSATFTQAQTVPHQQQGLGRASLSGSSSVNQPVAIEVPNQTPRRALPPTLTSASSPSINHSQTSPLAAFIPTLANSAAPSPLPFLPLLPPQIASLRGDLTRRRSSYPPSNVPGSTASSSAHPWVVGGTPTAELNAGGDVFPGFGSELTTGMAWTPGAGWEGLLDFDFDKPAAPVAGSSTPNRIFTNGAAVDAPLLRGKSEPGLGVEVNGGASGASADAASLGLPLLASPSKIAQFGSDLAWRTILGSVVEVEGVGEVGVARVLQEVWKRGGGDVVSLQSLWPSILIALSLPLDSLSPGVRISTPSIQASMALQNLYNLTLRSWEPAIFSGLLASFVAANPGRPPVSLPLPPQSNVAAGSTSAPDDLSGGMTPVYGSSTPTKELDLSHWMNVTPGADWSMLGLGVGAGAGAGTSTGTGANSPKSLAVTGVAGPGPSSLAFEIGWEASQEQHRRSSTSRTDEGDSTKGIDDLIAAMEEGREAHERHLVAQAAAMSSFQHQQQAASTSLAGNGKAVTRTASDATAMHLPTPETDSSESPGIIPAPDAARICALPATPATSNGSVSSTFTVSKVVQKQPVATSQTTPQTGHAKPAMQLSLPEASFVPPPPMCMFFSPSFHDLQNGKVGVWKGDLEIKGRGGGNFSVLIVGEEATGYLWQSQTWPSTIIYPSIPTPTESYTATMIPVSHLAREGFTPAAMGMVLCNDANISQYVSMVQGLHAEGVAFHLPSVSKLPIVFLPAKFNSADPLQRLGIAFMTKPGFPLPPRPPTNLGTASVATATAAAPSLAGNDEAASAGAGSGARASAGPRKRRRRQSAPSKSTTLGSSLDPASGPGSGSGSGSGGTGARGHKRRGTMQGLGPKGTQIEEEVIMEEEG